MVYLSYSFSPPSVVLYRHFPWAKPRLWVCARSWKWCSSVYVPWESHTSSKLPASCFCRSCLHARKTSLGKFGENVTTWIICDLITSICILKTISNAWTVLFCIHWSVWLFKRKQNMCIMLFFLCSAISLSWLTVGISWEWRWDIPIISCCSCWWRQSRASVTSMRSKAPVVQQRFCVWLQWRNPPNPVLLSRALLPALSCVQTCLLHLLDISWEVDDLPLFLKIKLPELLLSMSQDNISVHDVAIR